MTFSLYQLKTNCYVTIAFISRSKLYNLTRWKGMEGGGGWREGGKGRNYYSVLRIIHGRRRMTIDPRIPTMPGRSTSGFHRPGRHRKLQARSETWGVGPVAQRVSSILPRAAFEVKLLAYGWQLQWVDLISGVTTSRDSNGFLLCNCLVGALPYTHYHTGWYDHSPCAE